MGNKTVPTSREAIIMGVLIHGEKYGREIREEYGRRAGKKMPLGSLYVTLDRMDQQGFLKSRFGDTPKGRGGNRRKYFRLTAVGHRALDMYEMMQAAIRGVLGNV